MFFRRRYIIPQLRFDNSSSFVNDFSLYNGRLSVHFSTIPPDEPASNGSTHTSWADAILTVREPGPLIAKTLERLKSNSLPSGEDILNALIAAKSGIPWDKQTHVMLESMPQQFQDYAHSVEQRMNAGIERFVALLRWRYAQWGPPKAVKSALPLQWSADHASWHYMPFTPRSSLKLDVMVAFDANRQTEIIDLFDDNPQLAEPVYRELLREANQLEDSSRRSSLILAVAAAEIAIKTLIQEVKPDHYGVDLQTEAGPPATTMYSDIPKLPLRIMIAGKVLAVPARLLSELQKAVSARNGLAYVGAEPLDRDSLIAKMNAIRDLILIVDYYRGFAWTLDQLTQETKDNLAAIADEA